MAGGSEKYPFLKTEVPGVELRVVEGSKPKVTQKFVQTFFSRAAQYVEAKEKAERAGEDQKGLRDKIIRMVESQLDIRGIASRRRNFNLLAVKKTECEYDPDIMEESLGAAFETVATRQLQLTIAIPASITSVEELKKGLMKLLKDVGIPVADIDKVLMVKEELLVNEEKLEQMIEEGLELSPGAMTPKPSWAIQVTPLLKPTRLRKQGKKEKR